MGAPSDADLLAAVAAGDRGALATLYQRHAGWLTVRLSRRCGDDELVDSAVQDAFVSVWRGAPRWKPVGEPAAWLWSIALRRLVDQMRRRRPPVPVGDPAAPAPGRGGGAAAVTVVDGPDASVGTDGTDLLALLPGDLAAVVEAVYLDGLTTAEAGVLLGVPRGTVKSRLARARALLEEARP